MKIYTLTETFTQHSFSPKEVVTFVSHEMAHNEMIKRLHNYMKECKLIVPIEVLNDPNGYEKDGIVVGYDHAQDDNGMVFWEIFTTEINSRDVIIGNIIAFLHAEYVVPSRFDDVLFSIIDEYSDESLRNIKDMNEFVHEHIIGESLYQNALCRLGGKTDEFSYYKILTYLNEGEFLEKRCQCFTYSELSESDEKAMTNNQRWFMGMLVICSGDDKMVESVQNDIDSKLSSENKIFRYELNLKVVKEHKNCLPTNHRKLCSSLTDEEYYGVMSTIFKKVYHFTANEYTMNAIIKNFYEDSIYVLYKIIREYGCDYILDKYNYVVEVSEIDGVYDIVFVGDPFEVANCVDELKIEYHELF